jgi:hypothetical protein
MTEINSYVGTVAMTETEAREICAQEFHLAGSGPGDLQLVHQEPPEDPDEEQPTWIFGIWADSSEQAEGDGDWLHDLYTLPNLPNLPIEIV